MAFMVTVADVWRRSGTARRGIRITRRNPIWKEVVAHILDLDGYAAFKAMTRRHRLRVVTDSLRGNAPHGSIPRS